MHRMLWLRAISGTSLAAAAALLVLGAMSRPAPLAAATNEEEEQCKQETVLDEVTHSSPPHHRFDGVRVRRAATGEWIGDWKFYNFTLVNRPKTEAGDYQWISGYGDVRCQIKTRQFGPFFDGTYLAIRVSYIESVRAFGPVVPIQQWDDGEEGGWGGEGGEPGPNGEWPGSGTGASVSFEDMEPEVGYKCTIKTWKDLATGETLKVEILGCWAYFT